MHSQKLIRVLITVSATIAVWGLAIDVRNTAAGGSIDLRNRVTGARVAAEGIDPYTYKWAPGGKEEFCDPYNASGWPMSKTTVTPLSLLLHAPFNGVSYRVQQWAWLAVQYACLAAGFFAWAHGRPKDVRGWGAILTLALCGTAAWRLHVDRGQAYVLYAAFFLGLRWAASRPGKGWGFVEGLAGALLCGLRPVFAGALLRPVARRRVIALAGIAAGVVLVIALPSRTFGGAIWEHYRNGMERHAALYLEQAKPARSPMAFPEAIEGIPIDTLAKFAWIPFADSSLYKLMSFDLPAKPLLGSWALLMAAAAAGVVMLRREPAAGGDTVLWWAIAAWSVIGDFLLPAFRHGYNDVLVWPMLLLGLGALRGCALAIWTGCGAAWVLAQWAVWVMPKGYIPVPPVLGLLLALGAAAVALRLRPGGPAARRAE